MAEAMRRLVRFPARDNRAASVRTAAALRVLIVVAATVTSAATLQAQIQMPDARQMSGIPRPVTDLPDGSLSVRLIRGDLSNNIAGHPVELHIGTRVQTVRTDEAGRAQFDRLPAGETLRATAVVDGEALESQEFPAPSQGGIRLMLVATDKEKERQRAAEASAPPITGQVVIGGESRIVFEPAEESIAVYYILEIMNNARAPVSPATPLAFDMPANMLGTTVLQGSSPLASNNGGRVKIDGPFPPGKTMVEVGGSLPITGSSVELTQVFPALFEQPVFIAKKEGQLKVSSAQFDRQQETVVEGGTTVIIGAGNPIAAGQPFSLTLSGLAYHSSAPRIVAVSLAFGILVIGAVIAFRTEAPAVDANQRRRLGTRREKMLQELVRLELDRRRGRGSEARYAGRREELVAALEQVYGELDTDDALDLVPGGSLPARSLEQLGTS